MMHLRGREVLYAFCGWIRARKERIVMSGSNDCTSLIAAIEEFSNMNRFPRCRKGWGALVNRKKVSEWGVLEECNEPGIDSIRNFFPVGSTRSPIFVVANGRGEFEDWCHENLVNMGSPRVTYLADGEGYRLEGIVNPVVVYYGTYYKRRDIGGIRRLVMVRTHRGSHAPSM